ncbi:MAG TPA: hypothetical protein VJ773_01645 [Gemmatimonadales bacterium]|nr:hypothetical protein [Gemmatimonadales bacterium]
MRSVPLVPALVLLAAAVGCMNATDPSEPRADGVEISGSALVTARVGASVRLKALVYDRRCDFESCTYVAVAAKVNWSSTAPDVARIVTDAAGERANLLRPGEARIIASAAGHQDTLTVTVVP